VQVLGLDRLRFTLEAASERIEDLSQPAEKTSAFLASRGRADAPRRTGRLAASVRAAPDRNDAVVTSGLAYSNRTHWGYRRYRQAAQPWLAEGARNTEGAYLDYYEERVASVMRAVKGA
jgi:hypothetical protein